MTARRQPPEERRQDLFNATIACLARLGPRGATGREICREAGVSHGLLRHYFDNPDNLLLETYTRLCDQLLEHTTRETAGDQGDPWAALHRFFETLFSDDWARPDVVGAWMVFWQLARTNPAFAAVSDRFNGRHRALLERIARRLPDAGMGAPLQDAVAILSAVIDGLTVEYYLSEERTPRERAVALCDLTARRLFG